ncbi:hypothetical protein AAFC00_004195 [Neodothiora populina]|uniref:Deacetylase sirtuin-type domain-containing protein n=1 Tax=Neodothiora populina TaxID=2781224 RepID=A0ABR3PIW4_9PEZI
MSEDIASFSAHLQGSTRILALLGAGLSASSGLPTFRGAGGLWRTHDAMSLATPEAFEADPALVWQFYSYRRHMSMKARPNRAHFALAELARRKDGFMALSQNVDGLSQRAAHPPEKLQLLHGSLFNVKCTSFYCNYHDQNFTDPIVPALRIPGDESDPTTITARQAMNGRLNDNGAVRDHELDISDINVDLPSVSIDDLPRCPKCETGLLRPGVVWFGESLPSNVISTVDQFIADSRSIDLILVIGTSAKVYPAAGYVDRARQNGARVAVINMDRADTPASGILDQDWFFQGDAAEIVPQLLKDVVGEIELPR